MSNDVAFVADNGWNVNQCYRVEQVGQIDVGPETSTAVRRTHKPIIIEASNVTAVEWVYVNL